MNVDIIEPMKMELADIRKLELNPTGGAPENGRNILKERPLFRVIGTIDLTQGDVRDDIEQIISLTASQEEPQINMSKPDEYIKINEHAQMYTSPTGYSGSPWKYLFLVLQNDRIPAKLANLVMQA